MPCKVIYKGVEIPKDEFIRKLIDRLNLSDSEIANNEFLNTINYAVSKSSPAEISIQPKAAVSGEVESGIPPTGPEVVAEESQSTPQDAQTVEAELLDTPASVAAAGFSFAVIPTPSGKFRMVEINSKKPVGRLYDTREELLQDYEINKDKITPGRVAEVVGVTDTVGDYDRNTEVTYTDKIGETSKGRVVDFQDGRYIVEKKNGVKDIVPPSNINTEPVTQDIYHDRKNKLSTERVQVQRRPATPAKKKLPNIIADLIDDLKTPLIYAKSKRRNALASYNPTNALINMRNAGDLDSLAHESGHLIDDRFDLLGNKPAGVDAQLKWFYDRGGSNPPARGLTQAQKQQYLDREGLAEFIRAYVVNPIEAKRLAPELYDYFESTVNPETIDALKRFSEDYIAFANATAGDQILANIAESPGLKDKRSVIDWLKGRSNKSGELEITWADQLKSQVSDSLHAAKKAFDYAANMKGIGELLPEKNFETIARLFAGVNGKIDRMFQSGLTDSRNNFLTDNGDRMTVNWLLDPLDKTSKKALDQEATEVIQFMVAQRTVEYASKFGRSNNLSGIGGGVRSDLSVAEEYMQDFEALKNTNPDKADRIEEAARRYRAYADAGLRYALDKGRISKEQYDAIKDGNKYYVSMARIEESSPGQEPLSFVNSFSKGGLGSVKDVIHKAEGGTGTIQNPYTSLLKNTTDLINDSDRNEVLQNFVGLLTENRNMGQGEVKALSEIGREVQNDAKNTKTVFIDGKPQKWQFQEDVYKSLNGMERSTDGVLAKVMQAFPGLLRWTVTHFPSFAAKNFIRDTQGRLILSRSNGSVKDIISKLSDRELFDLYGGSQAGFHLTSREAYYDQMKRATDELTKKGGLVLDPRKIGELGRAYNKFLQKSENANRIAEFKSAFRQAKKQGMDDYNAGLYAAYQGRDLLDFAVAGHTIREINKYIPFTNAAIQGLKRTVQSAAENPKAFAIKTALYSVVPQVLTRMLVNAMGDDEEYEQLPFYQRDLFYNFKTPLTGDKWISIPKPFDLGLISSGVDRLISLGKGEKEGFEDFGKSLFSVLSPFDEATLLPVAKPLVEIAANKDLYRDEPIVPQWEENLMLKKREGTRYASNIGKLLSGAFGLVGAEADPRYIDHAIRGFTSYYGDAAMRLSNIGSETGKKVGIEQTGLVRERPVAGSRDVVDAYDLAEKLGKGRDLSVRELKSVVRDFYSAKTEADRDAISKKAYQMAKDLKATLKSQQEFEKEKEGSDVSDPATTITARGAKIELNKAQLKDRQQINKQYIEDYGEQKKESLKRSGKSEREIEEALSKAANDYSEIRLKEKYPNLVP